MDYKKTKWVRRFGRIFPAMVNSLIALKIANEERYEKEIKTVQKAINS